jgi:hypothetical protein
MNIGSPTDEKCQLMMHPLEPFIGWEILFVRRAVYQPTSQAVPGHRTPKIHTTYSEGADVTSTWPTVRMRRPQLWHNS